MAEKLLRQYTYKENVYDICLVQLPGNKFVIKDFKDGDIFSPFCTLIDDSLDIIKIEQLTGTSVLDFIISAAEESVRYWADNKDTIIKLLSKNK